MFPPDVGAPPLQWDPRLLRSCLYGRALAQIGRLSSPREVRPGSARIWRWPRPYDLADKLVGLWVRERQLFRPGAFPRLALPAIGGRRHYTQMCEQHAHVGCAMHQAGSGWTY